MQVRRVLAALGVALATVAGVVGTAAPASAAGPLIAFYDGPGLVPGSQAGEDLRLEWKWNVSDTSGVCSQLARTYSSGTGYSPFRSVPPRNLSSVTYTAPLGAYTFIEVQATDCSGQTTTASSFYRVPTLLDDRKLVYSGTWRNQNNANNLFSTIKSTTQAGAQASTAQRTDRFAVVANTCPTCGRIEVYVNGVKKATVSLRSPGLRYRAIVYQNGFETRYASVRIRSLGGGPVVLDGVLYNRT